MMNEATPWVKTTDLRETYLLEIVPADIPRGVTLEVKKSDFLTISGSSGSGKSTLLNLIGALDNPSDGKILIEDLDASPLSDNGFNSESVFRSCGLRRRGQRSSCTLPILASFETQIDRSVKT